MTKKSDSRYVVNPDEKELREPIRAISDELIERLGSLLHPEGHAALKQANKELVDEARERKFRILAKRYGVEITESNCDSDGMRLACSIANQYIDGFSVRFKDVRTPGRPRTAKWGDLVTDVSSIQS